MSDVWRLVELVIGEASFSSKMLSGLSYVSLVFPLQHLFLVQVLLADDLG